MSDLMVFKADRESFERIMTLPPTLFRVGPKEREFYVHGIIRQELYEPFEPFVTGAFKESAPGVVLLKDVSEATFIHFCQWLYTGHYHVQLSPNAKYGGAQCQTPNPAFAAAAAAAAAHNADDTSPTSLTPSASEASDTEHKPRVDIPVIEFPAQLQYALEQIFLHARPRMHLRLGGRPQFRISKATQCETWGDIYLTHAKIAAFAHLYQIPDLAAEALSNLHYVMTDQAVTDKDVLQVVEYTIRTAGMPKALRDLLMAYIATKVVRLWTTPELREMLVYDSRVVRELLELIMMAAQQEQ